MENILIAGLLIAGIFLSFWAIIDVAKSRFRSSKMNTLWLIIVFMFPIIGSLLYFQLKKRFVTSEPRSFHPKFNRTAK